MGTRTIIIGDVHGCHDELVDLLDRVGFADGDTLVSVGDLVDRGPDPGAVLELFRRTPGAVVVCGNHERKHVRGLLTHSQQITRLQLGEGYEEAVRWMSTLPYFYETDEVRVVHAGLIPGVPLADAPPEILSGTTSGEERLRKRLGGRWWHELYDEDKPVVFGHHVVQEPLVVEDRVFGIDTGACHGWSLTALVLPERRLVSVPARADHWAATRRRWQVPVLRSRPWASMSFEEIERRVGELRTDDPEALAFLDAVRAWAAAVRAAIPALASVLQAEVERLLAEVGPDELGRRSAAHPAGSWLVRWHAGRLQRDHLGCASPEAVQTLASALGHEGLVPPVP